MISEFIREDDPVDEFVERRAGQQRYGVVTSLEILVEIRHGPRGPVGWRSVARASRGEDDPPESSPPPPPNSGESPLGRWVAKQSFRTGPHHCTVDVEVHST
jgi:hypothetical protein